jgi:hypothetical protein
VAFGVSCLSEQFLTFFPQFCREPVNDQAWYPGFNDWDLIRDLPEAERGRFTPAAGYYDLSVDRVIAGQFAAVRASAWPRVALYHYFFGGRFVLSTVERFILDGGEAVPPFFVIWANETWTKRWIGKPSEVIIRQDHSLDPAVIAAHVDHLCRLFEHPSYSRVDGRPLIVLYSPYDVPDIRRFIGTYREAFGARGFQPLVGFCVSYVDPAFDASSFDFSLEFQPRLFFNTMRSLRQSTRARVGLTLKRNLPRLYESLVGWRDRARRDGGADKISFFEYEDYLELQSRNVFQRQLEDAFDVPAVPCAFYAWNNFPRYKGSSLVVRHRPGEFREFQRICSSMGARHAWSLVNSWNEWSEGAALEPGAMAPESYDLHDEVVERRRDASNDDRDAMPRQRR